jgi:HEPN domain-containing protein
MTPAELLLDEMSMWLNRARRDLRSAKALIDVGEYGDALFHCQQAAEKALKGFLAYHQTPFGKTHVLRKLGEQCLAIDNSLGTVLALVDKLTDFAWIFRYPDAPYEPDAAEAADGFQRAEAAVREIERRLPPLT